jgi:thiol-disulfide isomerase/thioredoxin
LDAPSPTRLGAIVAIPQRLAAWVFAARTGVAEFALALGPVGAVIGAVVLLAVALEVGSHKSANPLTVGGDAPEVALPRLDRPTDTLWLSSLRGKVVLLEMWNTSCANCREAMPGAELLARRYEKEGFILIHVANENLSDSSAMRSFLQQNSLTGIVVVDDKRHFLGAYHIWAVPWSVLIDRNGKVAWQYPGPAQDAPHPLLTKTGEALLRRVLES